MSIETRHPLPSRLHMLASLAGLLERLEAAPTSVGAEPTTWATMLVGFGLVGFTLRRRRSGASHPISQQA